MSKVLHEKNYSFLSTTTPTYWPTDENKIPDLLKFFITNGISTTYIDILLISETHFTPKNYFTITGYKICHSNHPD